MGRIPRHTHLNIIVKEALKSACIPSILEPLELMERDLMASPSSLGPMGTSLHGMPPAGTRLLPSTSAPQFQALRPWPARQHMQRKLKTYKDISKTHFFIPVAVESSRTVGKYAIDFFHQLAAHMRSISHDPLKYLQLCSRISISVYIQNFNCASILGCWS